MRCSARTGLFGALLIGVFLVEGCARKSMAPGGQSSSGSSMATKKSTGGKIRFFPYFPSPRPLVLYGKSTVDVRKIFGRDEPKNGMLVTKQQLAALGIRVPRTKELWLVGRKGACRATLGPPRLLTDVRIVPVVGAFLSGCPQKRGWAAPVALTHAPSLRWVPRAAPTETSPTGALFQPYARSVAAVFAKSPLKEMVMKARAHEQTKGELLKAWIVRVQAPDGGDLLVEVVLNKYYLPRKAADYDPCEFSNDSERTRVPRELIVRQWGVNKGGVFRAAHTSAYVRPDIPMTANFGLAGALVLGKRVEYAIITDWEDSARFDVYEIVDGVVRLLLRHHFEEDGATRHVPDTPYDQGARCEQG